MGTAHKVISACLRVLEFCSAGVILGILARFFHLIDQLDALNDSRLIFALSMAAISVFFSMILVPPVTYSFYLFAVDYAIFVCWIVCYSLLQDLAGTGSCSSSWFTSYWTVYWSDSGAHSVTTSPGCSQWRVVLAFSFVGAFVWLLSGFLSTYVVFEYHDFGAKILRVSRKLTFWKNKPEDLENGLMTGAEKPTAGSELTNNGEPPKSGTEIPRG